MHRTSIRSIAAPILAVGVVVAGFFGPSPAADAEAPAVAERTWGVEGVMPSASNNFNSPAWALHNVGDVMYVGGKFTTITSGPGGQDVNQPALGAFDARTGDHIPSFTPNVQGGSVFAIASSPDGSRLFVAGDFTSIDGVPDTAGLAALNPATGAVDPTWRASLERPWTDDPAVARALDVSNGWLYVGGTFTHVRSGSSRQQHIRVARVDLATGRPDAAFDPVVSGGGIWDIDPSPDGSRLYLAGFFSTVNGDAQHGDRFAAVQTSDGELVPGLAPFEPNLDITGRQYAVAATADKVFVAGEEHMVQVLDGDTLARENVYFTGSPQFVNDWALFGGGDYQALTVVGDTVYAGCHCWSYHLNPATGAQLFPTVTPPAGDWTPVRGIAAYDAKTGEHLPDKTFDLSGTSGVWAIEAAGDDCLWAGGALTQSGGSWIGNVAQFCEGSEPLDVERPSTPTGLRRDASGLDSISLRWTSSSDNLGVTGYEIYRSTDGTFGDLVGTRSVEDAAAGTTWIDTETEAGVDYSYAVKAVDAAGNRSWRSNIVTLGLEVADTERPSAPTGLRAQGSGLEINLTWNASTDNVGVASYQILRSTDGTVGDVIATVTGTTFADTGTDADQTYTYAVKAVDAANNASWRSNLSTATTAPGADTERPTAPVGLQASRDDGRVDLTWTPSSDNIGVASYQVIRMTGGTLGPIEATVDGTSATLEGLAPGEHQFTVRAVDAAGNTSWRANIVIVTVP